MLFSKKIQAILLSASLFAPYIAIPQVYVDPREADEHYQAKDYKGAIPVFKKLLTQSPDNISYHFKIGLCYLQTNIDKSKAIPYFEWITKQPKAPNEAWYELGVAYHYAYRFKDAINAFEHYIRYESGSNREKGIKQIEECSTGIELMKQPVNVTFTNLSNNINTQYPDYYPMVNGDESILIFTTRRPGINSLGVEMDGYYSSDIYIAEAVKGVWQKPKSVGGQINTSKDEEATGLNSSATTMVVYMDNIKQDGKIFYSERRGNVFSRPQSYPENVNDGFQSSGDVSADGKVLFFASERAGGYGGSDIYMVKKLRDGNWAKPQNLGPKVNTKYNEDFPWFDGDSVSLYFSSQGHNTMGDYDLFETIWMNPDSNEWSLPRNLGYPINTPDDDRCISFTKDHHAAYVSRVRQDGKGDLDIYRLTFKDMQRFAVVTGNVRIAGSPAQKINAIITTTNTSTNEQLYFKPVPKTGKYVMALAPGNYSVKIDCKGFVSISDKIVVYDLNSFQGEIRKDYTFYSATSELDMGKKTIQISYEP